MSGRMRFTTALVDGANVKGSVMLTPAEADAPLEMLGTTIDLFGEDVSTSGRVLVSDVAQQARMMARNVTKTQAEVEYYEGKAKKVLGEMCK